MKPNAKLTKLMAIILAAAMVLGAMPVTLGAGAEIAPHTYLSTPTDLPAETHNGTEDCEDSDTIAAQTVADAFTLQEAIDNAPAGVPTSITLSGNITLTDTGINSITIPEGRNITFTGSGTITGNRTGRQPTVRIHGELTIDGITVTHPAGSTQGSGVWVNETGIFTLRSGRITGNSGGLVNEGTFTMAGGEISSNTAELSTINTSYGGGVSNSGTFIMTGGEIFNNRATHGGGIYMGWGWEGGEITIRGGSITGNTGSRYGGGIYMHGGTFRLENGSIAGNTSALGAGVYVRGGELIMSGGSVANNGGGSGEGGGVSVALAGEVTMTGGTITGNGALRGGGVHNLGTFRMTGGSIDGNRAGTVLGLGTGTGGGVHNTGSFTMENGSISNNMASLNGGGVLNVTGVFTMSGGRIEDNEAGMNGGGIINGHLGTVTMTGGRITGNSALGNGGGIFVDWQEAILRNTSIGAQAVISGNSASRSFAMQPGDAAFLAGLGFTPAVIALFDNHQISYFRERDITDVFECTIFLALVRDALGKSAGEPILVSEAEQLTELHLTSWGITSLAGIEYFTGLTNLEAGWNNLTSLDLSRNTALTRLLVDNNPRLHTLNVRYNTQLTELFAGELLQSLDVTNNTLLTRLSVAGPLTELDVSRNTMLTGLFIFGQLTDLDLTYNTALAELRVDGSQLEELDLSSNLALTNIIAPGNQLTKIDLSRNTALTGINFGNNRLAELDVSRNTALTFIDVSDNYLYVLDVSQNPALAVLRVNNNELTGLDVSGTSVGFLNATRNFMASPDNVIGWRALGLALGTSFVFEPQRTPPVITVTGVTANPATLPHGGGSSAVTVTGGNLVPSRMRIAAFLNNSGLPLYTQTPTGTASGVSATLAFPANSTMFNRSYTVRISVDGGSTWLAAPTVSVSVPPAPFIVLSASTTTLTIGQSTWIDVNSNGMEPSDIRLRITPEGYEILERWNHGLTVRFTREGEFTVRAYYANNPGLYDEAVITVLPFSPITEIYVTNLGTVQTWEPVRLFAEVNSGANPNHVRWSVSPSDYIAHGRAGQSKHLRFTQTGPFTVRAYCVNNPGLYDEVVITVTEDDFPPVTSVELWSMGFAFFGSDAWLQTEVNAGASAEPVVISITPNHYEVLSQSGGQTNIRFTEMGNFNITAFYGRDPNIYATKVMQVGMPLEAPMLGNLDFVRAGEDSAYLTDWEFFGMNPAFAPWITDYAVIVTDAHIPFWSGIVALEYGHDVSITISGGDHEVVYIEDEYGSWPVDQFTLSGSTGVLEITVSDGAAYTVYTVNISTYVPQPVITGVTANPVNFLPAGGSSTVTAAGSNLVPSNMRIAAFLDNEGNALYAQQPFGSAANASAILVFPANTGTANRVYTVRVSVDDGATWLPAPTATVTVQAHGLTVYPAAWAAPQGGGSTTISVTSNIPWTVSRGGYTWLTVSPASGTNDGSFTITAAANTGAAQRSGTVTVTGGEISREITVTQPGEPLVNITGDFECDNFRDAVRGLPGVPDTGPIYSTHVANITQLNISSRNITSLAGIEHFTALTELNVRSNRLTELDLSANAALTRLEAWSNQLTALDLSQNTALTWLNVDINQLTALNVMNNTALTTLWAAHNQLTALDVSANAALTSLDVQNNFMTSADDVIGWQNIGLILGTTFVFYPQREPPSPGDITDDFECENFLAAVREITNRPYPQRILLSDVNTRTGLDVRERGITSLAGIEHFTALRTLTATNNQLTTLDLSANTALTSLYVGGNQLTALNVSANTALTRLQVSGNQLTALDVSRNTALTNLYVFGNQLSALDVYANTALTRLEVSGNQLTALNVSRNTALTILNVSGNRLTTLDVSRNMALAVLDVTRNFLSSPDDVIGWSMVGLVLHTTFFFHPQRTPYVDITADFECDNFLAAVRGILDRPTGSVYNVDVAGITELDVRNRNITSLAGIEHFTALRTLTAYNNQLTALDVSANTALTELYVWGNQLSALDVSNNRLLTWLDVHNNQLTALDVSANTVLTGLVVAFNQLTELDVSNNAVLTALWAEWNQLAVLNVSNNTELTRLWVGGNQLTALDVSNNTALEHLNAENNQITYVDVSENTALISLDLTDNRLTALNVSYNPDLELLRVFNNEIAELDVSDNTALRWLGAGGNLLETFDVSQNTALTFLDVGGNPIQTIDVSNNTALTDLRLWYLLLEEVDLSYNTALEFLGLDNNYLTELDLSYNPNLRSVTVRNNNLRGLDITNNHVLTGGDFPWNRYMLTKPAVDIRGNLIECPDDVLGWRDIPLVMRDELYDWHGGHGSVPGYTFLFNPQRSSDIDITDDFLCGNFLEAVRELTGRPYPERIYLSDVNARTELDVNNRDITSLAGVEHFTALTHLNAWGNRITEIDVSNNRQLVTLDVNLNQIDEIDVSQNTELRYFMAAGGRWDSIDVSYNTALVSLNVGGNLNLTELDVSQNPNLEWLSLHHTALTELDVSNNPLIEHINFRGGQIAELNLDGVTRLRYLHAQENMLKSLDLSNNPYLVTVDVRWNRMSEPDDVIGLHGGIALQPPNYDPVNWEHGFRFFPQEYSLDMDAFECQNLVAALRDIFNRPEPQRIHMSDLMRFPGLYMRDRGITSLVGLEQSPVLTSIWAAGNELRVVDMTNFPNLIRLDVSGNQLTELDVSQNTALTELSAHGNQLTELDVSNNTALTELWIGGNLLTELDVSNNTALTGLGLINNRLTGLDVSDNMALERLIVILNNMTRADDVIGWRETGMELMPEYVYWREYPGFHFFPQNKPTEPDGTLAISTTFANAGGTATVQLRMDDNPGFAAMMMRLTFDDRLTFMGYELGHTRMSAAQLEDLRDGFVREGNIMGWTIRDSNIYLRGVLLTLTFNVGSNVQTGDFLPIEIVFENAISSPEIPTNADEERLNIAITGGGVNVQPFVVGDANRDGFVTSADGTRLARYLAGHNVSIDRRGMDLNLDGYVDGADLTQLANWLVGRGAPPAALQQ